jgi:hypothetical protein
LEKYFDGNTSLEDEKILKDFFQGESIPPHLVSLKETFNYFSQEKTKDELDESFDDKVLSKIGHFEISHKRQTRRRFIYYASGIAASILIIISIFTNIDPFTSTLKDTFDDPEIAFNETKRALILVSETLNRGVKPVEKIAKFDDGMEQMEKFKSLGTGMEEFEKVSKFYETQKKVINN